MKNDSESPQNVASGLVHKLEKENIDLRHQINEMESFLSDYGLHWIGEKDSSKPKSTTNLPQAVDMKKEFRCDYNLMVENINELNSMTDYNEPQIVESSTGAKFETVKSVQLTLFANGIALYEGPFRSFEDSLTRKFCIDIMDGYFPSELESQFPEGVPFRLVDKREIHFKNETNSVFRSKGYRLGSPTSNETQMGAKRETPEIKNIETQLNENPLTIDQFLNKLPTSVIKNGNMISIREELSSLIKNDQPDKSTKENDGDLIINTPALEDLKLKHPDCDDLFSTVTSNKADQDDEKNIVTLKVKSLSSTESNVYLIKMYYSDTIQQLKDYINSHRKLLGFTSNFDLATMFPRTVIENMNSTLKECGLGVPKANVTLIPQNS